MILEAKFEEDLEPVVLSYRSHEKLFAQNAEQFLKIYKNSIVDDFIILLLPRLQVKF